VLTLKARRAAALLGMREQQALAYSQAVLTAIAVSNPKNLPKFDKVFPDPTQTKRRTSAQEALAGFRAWSAIFQTDMRD
jgi:hypothetical protein